MTSRKRVPFRPYHKLCRNCGNIFEADFTDRKYCSIKCKRKDQYSHMCWYYGFWVIWHYHVEDVFMWEEKHGKIEDKVRNRVSNSGEEYNSAINPFVVLFDDGNLIWWS